MRLLPVVFEWALTCAFSGCPQVMTEDEDSDAKFYGAEALAKC